MGIVPDSGRDEIAAILSDETSAVFDTMAVGTDGTAPSSSTTSLGNEVYRAAVTDASVDISTTGSTGEIQSTITVAGGREVPADTKIREYAIISSNDVFVYVDAINPITVNAAEEVAVTSSIDILNQ